VQASRITRRFSAALAMVSLRISVIAPAPTVWPP